MPGLGFFTSETKVAYLVGGDWNHGIRNDFPYVGNGKINPTDEVHHFSEG